MADDRSSGSNAGVVILIALLVLAVPCCGGVAFVGLGVFAYRAAEMQPVPMDAQMAPPKMIPDGAMELQPQPELPVAPVEPIEPVDPGPSFEDLLPKADPAGESRE